MAKKKTIIEVSATDNDPKVVTITTDQDLAIQETVKLLNEKIQLELAAVQAKEIAIAKLVALGLTEEDIKAVIK